ncbi:MAG TPA: twin-arginine translocase TatA/TatE family subunit [Fluviicola sp.]|nr:twin-arginine translocase TatA/TatE family subunit [Fluviicola sp.]
MVSLPLIFSDIAGSEILLILVFVLIFFGSKSIPGIAQSLGRTIRQIKDASNDVQNEIKKSAGDIKGDFNLQRMMDETKSDIERPFREHAQTLDQAMNFEPPRAFVRPVEKLSETPAVPADQENGEPAATETIETVQPTPETPQQDK